MKSSTKRFFLLAVLAIALTPMPKVFAQSTATSQAVESVSSGNKVFLEINASQLQTELNQLFSASSAASNLSWGDVLGNGSNPGMDINFSSYQITGLGGLTSSGTLVADSLTLNKDADITGKLSVTNVVNFNDSLTVTGYVELSDSLEVVKAVAVGETLYVTGVTSLGDSLHVVGNVDLDALLNVDGAATFGSTITVTGKTTLNDSLHVSRSADFAENVSVEQHLYVDSISSLNTNGVSLSADEFAAISADTIRADFDNLNFTGRFENDSEGLIALLMESNSDSPYNTYDGRFYAEHAEAFSGLEFDIDEDEDDADIKIEAVATNNGTEYGRARVYAESEGDHADAGFSVLADDDTNDSNGEFEVDIDSDDGRAEAHIDLRDGTSLRAELEFERSDWDDSYDITLRTDEGDVDVIAGDLLQLTGGRAVTLTADSVIAEGRFGSRFGASFDETVEIDGETTLNDSLHVNSGVDITGDLVVNDTNLLQFIASLEARIAALEAGGGQPESAPFTCGTSTVTFDGHDYSTVEIGGQCWFAENLRTTQYADGSAISEVTDNNAWSSTNDGARAAYNNDASNVSTYGYLYNWYAVNSASGLCPSGWHVATDEEWTTLTTSLGGLEEAGVKMKSSASDSPSWNGTNSSGFSALPGGSRNSDSGNFGNEGFGGYWWSASPNGTSTSVAWTRILYSTFDKGFRAFNPVRYGYSVRCLRDAEVVSSASVPTVSSAAASDLAETTVTLNGTVDADGGDAVTATGFVWGTDATLSGASDASGSATSGAFTASLTGLTGGTTYYFSAYATNGEGTAYGDTLSFTTEPAAAPFTCGTSTVTFDGHDYSTVEIGGQCWFAENLRTTQYADGSAISEVTDGSTWGSTNDGARAAFNNDASNVSTYGYLYNWYAVNSASGLCPSGWHVATDEEWTTLTTSLGGASEAGVKIKSSASDTPSWNGTNSSGFSALPGGSRNGSSGAFSGAGSWGYWWSASPAGTLAWYRYLGSGIDNVGRNDFGQGNGFSVRCLKDE